MNELSEEDWGTDPEQPKPITRPVEKRMRANEARELPFSEEAEQHVLACCLLDGAETIQRCHEAGFTPDFFFLPANRIIYETIDRLDHDKKPVDLEVVASELMTEHSLDAVGGLRYLMEVTSKIPTTAHAGYFIEKMRVCAFKRSMIEGLTGVVEHARNGDGMDEIYAAAKDVIDGLKWGSNENISDLLYDPSKDIEKPVPIYTAAGTTICTPGNLTTFRSQAKAGKTAIIGAMIAAACDVEGSANDTLGFRGVNTEGHAVLCFDTEQSRYDWQQMIKTAMRRVKLARPPKWLLCYHLTGKSAIQARKIIDKAIVKAKKDFGGIFAIFIDGVADLCLDVNDAAESNELVAHQHGLAIEHNCAIINVLHMNAGSENEKGRGHLGSQLERKSESNLTLEKVDEVTSYWGIQQRGKMISKAGAPSFRWSDEAYMHISCQGPEPKNKGGSAKKYTFPQFREVFHRDPAKVLNRAQSFKYAIEIAPIKEATWRDLLADATTTGELIRVTTPGGYYYHLPAI